jgi:hypothetical protein
VENTDPSQERYVSLGRSVRICTEKSRFVGLKGSLRGSLGTTLALLLLLLLVTSVLMSLSYVVPFDPEAIHEQLVVCAAWPERGGCL